MIDSGAGFWNTGLCKLMEGMHKQDKQGMSRSRWSILLYVIKSQKDQDHGTLPLTSVMIVLPHYKSRTLTSLKKAFECRHALVVLENPGKADH